MASAILRVEKTPTPALMIARPVAMDFVWTKKTKSIVLPIVERVRKEPWLGNAMCGSAWRSATESRMGGAEDRTNSRIVIHTSVPQARSPVGMV
jgi:hypothetical protein